MLYDQQIAATIIEQLGGLSRLKVMIGAGYFITIDSGVQFWFGACREFNRIQITLEPSDTYKMRFMQVKNLEIVREEIREDVYWDMMIDIFESVTGLTMSLGSIQKSPLSNEDIA